VQKAHHFIEARRENLHGCFFRGNRPVLTVSSGSVVAFETLEVGWRTERVMPGKDLERIEPRDPILDNGPALTGPVYVEGAKPGTVLEIEFLHLEPGQWGWTSAGWSFNSFVEEMNLEDERASLFWTVDRKSGRVSNQLGYSVPLRPFLGCVGLAPADPEPRPGWDPHPRTGGNLDATILQQGSKLFLPVEVEGALLSVGDGHAAQGDGEVSGNAIECPMDEVRLRLTVHAEEQLAGPRALVDGCWATFGIASTLDQAAALAMNHMLDLIQEATHVSRAEALALSSSVVDLRITQIVNPLKGVHAVLKQPLEQL